MEPRFSPAQWLRMLVSPGEEAGYPEFIRGRVASERALTEAGHAA
jgi:hypothetical protein